MSCVLLVTSNPAGEPFVVGFASVVVGVYRYDHGKLVCFGCKAGYVIASSLLVLLSVVVSVLSGESSGWCE